MPKITINVPPDKTPEEEAALVMAVAAAYEDSHGNADIEIEVNHPDEVDFQSLADRTQTSSRWNR